MAKSAAQEPMQMSGEQNPLGSIFRKSSARNSRKRPRIRRPMRANGPWPSKGPAPCASMSGANVPRVALGEFVHAFSPHDDSPADGPREFSRDGGSPRSGKPASDPESTASLRILLRDRTLPTHIVEDLLQKWSPLSHPSLMRAFLRHPALSRTAVRRLASTCPWRPLAEAVADPLTRSEIRPLLEAPLLGGLESMSLGETVALARMARGRVLRILLENDDGGVLMACAENPTLDPKDMVDLLSRETLPASLIEGLSRSARWSLRQDILRLLATHPRANPRTVLRCLRKMDHAEIERVARDDKAPHYPRKVAEAIVQRYAARREGDRRGT